MFQFAMKTIGIEMAGSKYYEILSYKSLINRKLYVLHTLYISNRGEISMEVGMHNQTPAVHAKIDLKGIYHTFRFMTVQIILGDKC